MLEEPCFVFEICSRYAGCVQHGEPDKLGYLLLILYERALERYCYNPVFMLKAYFATLLETLRKWTIKIQNGNSLQSVMTGMDGEDRNTFLNRWIEIRKFTRLLFRNDHDLIFLEGHMFTGLQDYLNAMESTVRQVEAFVRKDSQEVANCKDNMCVSLSSNMTMMYLTSFGNRTTIQKITYTEQSCVVLDGADASKSDKKLAISVYVTEPPKPKKKKTKRRHATKKKKAAKKEGEDESREKVAGVAGEETFEAAGKETIGKETIGEEEDIFVPIQIPWEDDKEDDLFIPQQYDFTYVQEVVAL